MEYETSTTKTNKGVTTTMTTTRTSTSSNEFFGSSLGDDIGEIGALLDNSAAKHKISVRPTRGKRSPSIPTETKVKQEKEATIRELIETEEEFVRDLKYLITNYIRWIEEGTPDGKILAPHSQFLFGGLQEIYEFHKTVLLEGMKYYASQPNQIGRSFVRLERDFDKHAAYIDRLENIVEFLNENPNLNEAFYNRSIELNDTGRALIDYARLPSQRLNDYSLLLSDLIKICNQLGEPTSDLEKGLELVNWIPSKSRDIKFIQSIEGFGDTRVGRILRHDWFRLIFGGREKERYCFLFKNKLLVTKVRRISPDRSVFILKNILQLPELQLVDIERSSPPEPDQKEQGSFGLLDKEGNLYVFQSEASIVSGWIKDVKEFTAPRSLADEPAVKRGRIVAEVQESVTINGVEITDVTSVQEDRSFSEERQTKTGQSRQRVINIPIQVESSDDTSLSERVVQENKKNTSSKVDVVELEQSVSVDVKECIEELREEEEVEKTQSIDESVLNNETVEEQKEIPSETAEFVRTVTRSAVLEDTDIPIKLSHSVTTESETTTRQTSKQEEREIPINISQRHSSETVRTESSRVESREIPVTIEECSYTKEEEITPTRPQGRDIPISILTSDRERSQSEYEQAEETTTTRKQSESFHQQSEQVKSAKEVETKVEETTTGQEARVSRSVSSTVERGTTQTEEEDEAVVSSSRISRAISREDSVLRKTSSDREIKPSKSTSSANLIRMESSGSDGEKPEFARNVKSVQVEPGDNAVLTVETKSATPSIVTWLKENKPLDDRLADRVKIVSKENVHSLTLLNASDEDSGLYTAKCSNQYGTTCSSGFINVHEFTPEERQKMIEDGKPNFIVTMKDTELLRDTTICFIVRPSGDPEPTLKFYKNGVPLKESDRITVVKSGDETELTILNITDDDVGEYSCVATNKYGDATTKANLSVTDEKSVFPGLENRLLEPGEEPEFTWYRDGVAFSPEDKFKVLFKDDEDSLALVFQHVRPEDAGLYTCVASTSSGRISCSAELTVQGAIHQLLREPEAPVITANLTDTEVSTGGSAMLEVKVAGFPKPDVAWFKDGKEIQAGGRYRFLYEDDESIALIIKGVEVADGGLYNVVAKNDLGEASTSGRLTVNSPPKFKAKMQDCACMTDEPFSMSVTVHGSPQPEVKWYKDGQIIIESERIQMTKTDDGTFTITFEKIKLEDGGAYSVVASNSIGQMSEFWNMIAHSRAKFTKTIEKEYQIKETETIEMSVEVSGNPEPEVKWLVNEKSVSTGTSYTYKSTSRNDEKITVQCTNAFGTDECSGDVHVLKGSKITSGLKDTKVTYNADAEFTIKVDEFPKGKVKWFIDGIEIDGKKYQREDDGSSHTLKIKGVTAAANIKVRAENEYGYDEQEARLDVIVKPTITKPLKESYTEVENHELKLSVDIQANPEPDVTWYHNGEQVDADARIKIKREGTETWSLTFNVLLPSDSGDWTVKSKNEAGEAESKTVVIVEGKPEFEKKLVETVECIESDCVAFEVKVRGVPSPVIQWALNKEELTKTTKTSIETTESRSTTVSKLVINNTLLEDAGVVTCVARNEHGECETSSQLIVQKSGPKLKLDASPRVVEAGKELKLTASAAEGAKIDWGVNGTKEKGKGGEFKLAPAKDCIVTVVASDGKTEEKVEIPVRVMSRPKISGLSDVNAGPGESVTLTPKVESEPDGLEVAWYRGEEKIKDCKEGDYSLTLSNLSQADAGKYTLVAKNLVGETSAYAKVNVLVEPPSFTRGLADTKLREGEPLTLRVRVTGVPEPKVSWDLDGKTIPIEAKDGTYELALESIALDQFGTYTVKAENVAGAASTTGKITLIEERPIIAKGPERSKSVDEKEPLTLTAQVSGSPKPTVQWFKDGEPLKLEPGRVEVTSGPGDAQKLVIAKAEKADEGVYTLEAKNPVSVAKSGPSQVTVVPVPVLPTIRITAPLEAELDSNITLKLEVTGEPEPKVTIHENDKPIEPIRISREGNSNVFNYVVKAPARGDQVNYSAVAQSPAGKANDAADVKLVPPPAAPVIIESLPAEKSAVDGTPLKLQSVLSGSPLPKIQWLRDNVPVPFEVKEINGKLHTSVLVDAISPAEAGLYKLVAENPTGAQEQKCQVGVLTKTDDSKPMEPPSFTTSLPENLIVSEGDDLVLTVGVSGNPLPDVQWGRITDSGEKGAPADAAKQPGAGAPAAVPAKAVVADNAESGAVPAAARAAETGPDAAAAKAADEGSAGKPSPAIASGIGNAGLPPSEDLIVKAPTAAAPESADVGPKGDAGDADLGDGSKAVPAASVLDDATKPAAGDAGLGDAGNAALGDALKPTAGDAGLGDASKAAPADGGAKDAKKATTAEPSTVTPGAGAGVPAPGEAKAQDAPRLEPLKSVLGPDAKIEESFDGKNATIRIPGVRQSFEGPISVQLSNPLGTKTETVNVGVRKVYSPARIVDKFNDVHQVRGGDARFTAKITGEPRPELEWLFNGKPLAADRTKYGTKWDGRTGSLTVFNVTDKDLGKYTLIARNIEGSDECSGVLKEITGGAGQKPSAVEKGEAPYFLKKIADAEFYEGMTVKFTACVGGVPEPEFHWFKDDMRVYPGARISMENSDSGLLRLIILKAGPQDLGTYTLKIFNKYGEDQCKATCSIEDYQGRTGGAQDTKLSGSKPTGPPNPLPDAPIISSMTDRHLTLSWKPALRTHIDYPVTYTVEMAPAGTNDWFTLRRGIKGCCTEVRNLEPGKDYKFRIRVENRIGVSEPSPYAQTLRYKFDWKPTPWTPPSGDYDLNRPPHPGFTHAPKFLNKNTEQYGVPGAGLGVEWWLYGYPKPSVTFFFNGEEISNTDHVFENNGRVVLYIDRLTESRQGWYECVGVNEHGEDRYRIHVLQGEHPRWIIRLDETHIMERRDGKLTGVCTGKPQPEFKWYKDWNTLAETSRVKFSVLEVDSGTYRVTCTLSDSILKDHGLYSCAASNVVGTASSSANITIDETEEEWRYKSYNKRLSPLSLKNKPVRDFYAFGDELGRGTQGITRHATSIQNGNAVAVKSMESGDAQKREWMRNEFNIHSDLFHPGITRVSDGYQDERGVHIVTDLCTGGDIVSNCISRGGFSESQVADYIRQLLNSLDYLHNNKSIAHLGINPFDLHFSHEDGETLKLTDFGLARRITSRLERLDFGQPEFASPEALNGEGAGFQSDLWSVGIITYLLLNGSTPFLGDNDQDTMNNVKKGSWELMNSHLSDSCQDFIKKLLVYDPRGRLDVRRALDHPWIARYYANSDKKASSSLHSYHSRLTRWYENASCRTIYRRNPWSGAYTHPSRMIYPPGEIDFEMNDSSRDTKSHVFGVPNYPRPDLNVEVGIIKSESHYAQGPDTYLLQLRDPDFPSRLRQYMKVAASRSPTFALQLKSQAYDRNNPIIRERRRFQDVMDEEVKDELTQGKEWRGEPRRLRHEVGIHLDTTAQADAIVSSHKEGTAAFIREGPAPVVRGGVGDNVIIKCVVDGLPEPIVQWFKNDIVLGKTNRIDPTNTHLIIENFNETDYGLYKLAARNSAGSHTIKFRINQGHYTKPAPTELDYSIESTSKLQIAQGGAGEFTEILSDGNFGSWSLGTISSNPGKLVRRVRNPATELDTQASLAHYGLLNTRSVISENDSTYFVYNESTDDGYVKLTEKFIQEGVYNELDITNAVQQILSALGYIQWRGLQLLNLSLDNILVDKHGNVKLFDTGSVARVAKIGSTLPIPETVTQFTAPEYLVGDAVHTSTDAWSVGCLVYTLLSGCWPFAGDDDKLTRGNIQFVRYRFEPLYSNSTPEATRFLMMIFKKCPLRRPTIEELQDSRWLSTQDSLTRRRAAASFKSLGLEKLIKSSSFIIRNS